jgi:hypothetical protein
MANPSTTLYPSDTFYPSDGAGKGAGPFTALSIMALPGRRHSFIAKTAATAEKGAGPFTELSALGLPGQRHAFTPKTAATAEKGAGPFTELSALGLPGQRHAFTPKTAAQAFWALYSAFSFSPAGTAPGVYSQGRSGYNRRGRASHLWPPAMAAHRMDKR